MQTPENEAPGATIATQANGHLPVAAEQPPQFASLSIAIAGLGLMGGSLALALKAAGHTGTITGLARRRQTIDTALRLGAIDWGSDTVRAVADADLVVLATPVRIILRQMGELAPHIKPGALLMDLGSTKQEICAALDRTPPHIGVLGGHPMCGKETSGIDVADAALYHNKTFVLCPCARSSDAVLATGLALVAALGARPLVLDPARHDGFVAAISHLPYLLSLALVTATAEAGRSEPQVWDVAASGFRDTSRLAASDPDMMLDILLTNRPAVLAALARFRTQLDGLAGLLAANDEAGLREVLLQGRTRRVAFAAAHAARTAQPVGEDNGLPLTPQGEPA